MLWSASALGGSCNSNLKDGFGNERASKAMEVDTYLETTLLNGLLDSMYHLLHVIRCKTQRVSQQMYRWFPSGDLILDQQ